MNIESFTAAQLNHAADLKEKIAEMDKELASILGVSAPTPAKTPKKRKMSAAGRARVAAAQKARWAAIKAKAAVKPATGVVVAKPAVKPVVKPAKRKMSAAAKAKLSAAAKLRWAKVKAAGKKSL